MTPASNVVDIRTRRPVPPDSRRSTEALAEQAIRTADALDALCDAVCWLVDAGRADVAEWLVETGLDAAAEAVVRARERAAVAVDALVACARAQHAPAGVLVRLSARLRAGALLSPEDCAQAAVCVRAMGGS